MDQKHWNAILSRIGPNDADDLDDILAPCDPRRGEAGRDVFPLPEGTLMPQAAMKRADAVCIGLRVAAEAAGDAADRAMRLAAFAIERDVEVIVLSEADRSGLERFGFRIEQVSGNTPEEKAACEDQIRRFWNIDLVL